MPLSSYLLTETFAICSFSFGVMVIVVCRVISEGNDRKNVNNICILDHLRYILLVQVPKHYTRNNLSWINSMADEEPVDQKKYFEESCKPKCVKPLLEYQACVKRIEGDESGHKHCTGQYFDYWSCIDKCVAPKLFPKLK
ncbi:hypothetical protein SAY87_001246 [Trapa incisa]|uniref:Complex III subunit VI n=1 Tax=Trapa incisa TaxID=236973 RepID=A0AAN7JHI0_9MYRT|nr:hypothetical protein SAY87_001246 [Trapa incisa]